MGGMDLADLEQKLFMSVQHALCDFVCEYYALTAPLCEPPIEVVMDAQQNPSSAFVNKVSVLSPCGAVPRP